MSTSMVNCTSSRQTRPLLTVALFSFDSQVVRRTQRDQAFCAVSGDIDWTWFVHHSRKKE